MRNFVNLLGVYYNHFVNLLGGYYNLAKLATWPALHLIISPNDLKRASARVLPCAGYTSSGQVTAAERVVVD